MPGRPDARWWWILLPTAACAWVLGPDLSSSSPGAPPKHPKAIAESPACERRLQEIRRITEGRGSGELDHDPAHSRLEEVASRAEDDGCVEAHGMATNGLGVVDVGSGRLLEALAHLEDAERIYARRAPTSNLDHLRRLELEQNRATAALYLGWLDEADLLLGEVLERWRDLDDPKGIAEVQMLRSRLKRIVGEPEAAWAAVQEAARFLDRLEKIATRLSILQEAARLRLESGDLAEAEDHVDQALEWIGDPSSRFAQVLTLDRVEILQARGQWPQSRRELEKLRSSEQILDGGFYEAHFRFLEARAEAARDRLDDAIRAADRGLAVLETFRRSQETLGADFLALRRFYHWLRLDLAIRKSGAAGALEIFETYRARGLLRDLRAGSRAPSAAPCSAEDEAWRLDQIPPEDQSRRLAQRRRLLRCVIDRRMARASEPADDPPRPSAERERPAPIGRDLLGDDPALILALGSKQPHLLWWPPGAEPVTFPVSLSHEQLARSTDLEELRSTLETGGLSASLHRLGRGILSPILDRLDDFSHLWVAADGPLDGFPIELIVRPDTERPLFETHAVSYLPSLTVLAAIRERAPPGPDAGSVAIFGDPIFSSRGDERWPAGVPDPRSPEAALRARRLRESGDEARAVAELYRRDDRPVSSSLGASATRERLVDAAGESRILHLATHAVSDPAFPERSKIRLSCVDTRQRPAERCDLYLDEVAGLRLRGSLVVLSACESHAGRLRSGEGPLALSRAFLAAGASAVVASLWQVPDRDTAALMVAFHRHLVRGETVASALRRAKLELVSRGGDRRAWSGFVVYGDGARRFSEETHSEKISREQPLPLNLSPGAGSHTPRADGGTSTESLNHLLEVRP